MRKRSVVVRAPRGLDTRAAMKLVSLAQRFRAEVGLQRKGSAEVTSARSILGVVILACCCGETLVISADGEDEERALAALCGLVERGFESE